MSYRGASLPVRGETICPYCGVGCRLEIDGEVGVLSSALKIRGVADAPANLGRLCAKGALLGETIVTEDRLAQPMMRASRPGPLKATSWAAAMNQLVQRMRAIVQKHGPDSI